MSKLLYTVAINNDRKFIKAVDAEKGNDYYCPVCKDKLILRKSGNTGKGSKRPHFAHHNLTPNCTPESALHFSFKNLLFIKIQECIKSQESINISWNCKYCNDNHKGNLLKKATSVKLEYNLKVCQPDIALLDSNNNVVAVIEVVVTHKPEPEVIKFYKDNKIILIQINLTSDKDIELLIEKISNPDIVDFCINPKCITCGNYSQITRMMIINGPCWSCENTMKIATIFSSDFHGLRGKGQYLSPSDFNADEIEFAKSKGVILKIHYSNTLNSRYLANTCGKCGKFAGDFYLYSNYISQAAFGDYPSQTYDKGYSCQHCDEIKLRKEI